GMTAQRFDELWRETLRKKYWPTLANLDHPDKFARRLTDHRRDESLLNFWPSVSPQGDRVAYFSDRRQYNDVYLMSAFDGRVLRRVVRAERNLMFEAIPLLRTSITWSPDGDRLALIAGSAGRDRGYGDDALFELDLASGKTRFLLDTAGDDHSPAWSPDGKRLAFITDRSGAPNLALFETRDSTITQLTDLTGGVQSLTWSRQNDRL